MLAAVFVSVMTLLPLAALAAGVLSGNWALMLFSALNVALMYAFRFVQDGQVGLSRLYGLTHPLGTAVLVGIIVISMWRGVRGAKTRWKGRPVQG